MKADFGYGHPSVNSRRGLTAQETASSKSISAASGAPRISDTILTVATTTPPRPKDPCTVNTIRQFPRRTSGTVMRPRTTLKPFYTHRCDNYPAPFITSFRLVKSLKKPRLGTHCNVTSPGRDRPEFEQISQKTLQQQQRRNSDSPNHELYHLLPQTQHERTYIHTSVSSPPLHAHFHSVHNNFSSISIIARNSKVFMTTSDLLLQ